jgi:transposase
MRQVRLTENEQFQLEKLQKQSANSVIYRRCLCLLLSNKGNSLIAISSLLNIHWNTVSRLLDRWEKTCSEDRFSALYSFKGQGAKAKLSPVADILPALIERHSRNLKPILEKLEKKHLIQVCKLTLQTFLKGTGL